MKNSFIRLRLFRVPTQYEDLITGHAFEFGATGLSEVLSFRQPDLTYDPDLIPASRHDLDIYFPDNPPESFYTQLKTWVPQLQWEVREEENKDWLAEWKKGFAPFQLVGNFWVVPSWCEPPKEAKYPIFIDPGMAFGTGTHATTQMASYFVNKLCSNLPKSNETNLIDVGTGTGILAMLASHHNLGKIKGIEIDPEARRVARENLAKNSLQEKINITDELIENIDESYHIVVANIIDGVLIQIRDHLLRILAPGGHIFLTGILLEREDTFLEEFIEPSGLKMLRRIEKDEWVGFWLQA